MERSWVTFRHAFGERSIAGRVLRCLNGQTNTMGFTIGDTTERGVTTLRFIDEVTPLSAILHLVSLMV